MHMAYFLQRTRRGAVLILMTRLQNLSIRTSAFFQQLKRGFYFIAFVARSEGQLNISPD